MLEEMKPCVIIVTAPPKRWRNKWSAPCTGYYMDGDTRVYVEKGVVEFSKAVFPSREIAEQRAEDWRAKAIARGQIPWVYDGAFPTEQQP